MWNSTVQIYHASKKRAGDLKTPAKHLNNCTYISPSTTKLQVNLPHKFSSG